MIELTIVGPECGLVFVIFFDPDMARGIPEIQLYE